MPTTMQRVQVPFESEIYEALTAISKAENIPMSQLINKLVTSALEFAEDLTLSEVASKRMESFRRDDAMTTKEMLKWNKDRKKRK
jgi:hypothetical protein